MGRTVIVAATQMACDWNLEANVNRAEGLVRDAAQQGAQIILLQELFETPYFCKDQKPEHFDLARPADNHPLLDRMSRLAAELEVVLPISFFERAGNACFNSLVVMDADGSRFPVYRKAHIPDGPGYQEKFYFSPGDTGFQICDTRYARIGVAVCWDQWFPEAARAMALQGAEMLMYPTAIGSEPKEPQLDSRDHWQRTMQGHAAANLMPVVASNRVGVEEGESCTLTFYGSSFITDATGGIVAQADREGEKVLVASFDLDALAQARRAWGLFRDRRPDLYAVLGSFDGVVRK
ncbi:MAG: N-carbamoylputrescine amidase [Thiogranum sp.]|nr:N-carbamoylputrescine amidase [Thiogranum sp.]